MRVGELPPQLGESSGMAASAAFPGRLYHINDSGDGGRFYVTALDGTGARTVNVSGFRPRDTEALTLGPCPAKRDAACLYIGDIGDNGRRRPSIEIVAVEEEQRFPDVVKAIARFALRYPDGPHNAESMAMHPDGTLFVLTKEQPARLYKARLQQNEHTLEFVTTVNAGNAPTDMAISPDGERALVLTYLQAAEFAIDFKNRRTMTLSLLQQQESAAYLPDGRSMMYSTERGLTGLAQPIMRMDCIVKR